MVQVPEGSIYFWMYEQGLKHVDLEEIEQACYLSGVAIRKKDYENYWNGWYKHSLYMDTHSVLQFKPEKKKPYFDMAYTDYPIHPFLNQPEIIERWVPCNKQGKPLYKWGNGCMTKINASCMLGCESLAENLKGTKMVVIDCDGDHEDRLDVETIMFLSKYMDRTHCLFKPKRIQDYGDMAIPEGWAIEHPEAYLEMPASYHLTFLVDRVIPTMHFPKAHIDIAGNKMNQLRYLKNKQWNGVDMAPMTTEIWEDIKSYLERRESQ